MSFRFDYTQEALDNLRTLRSFDRKAIREKMQEQLTHQPDTKTKNKKPIIGEDFPWGPQGIVWELKVGEFRVFYEVEAEEQVVLIGAIRHKPPHKTTGEIL